MWLWRITDGHHYTSTTVRFWLGEHDDAQRIGQGVSGVVEAALRSRGRAPSRAVCVGRNRLGRSRSPDRPRRLISGAAAAREAFGDEVMISPTFGGTVARFEAE